jgi:hypothetical protein
MMNCAEFEILLADYADGTLSAADRALLEQHAQSCTGCQDLLKDVCGVIKFISRAEEVTPPPELITRIAYYAPAGRIREPLERQGFLSKLVSQWIQPILQPRLAMGMAMTVLSFAMLERCTGVRIQQIQTADLNPVRIWSGVEDRTVRLKDRAVKYYENLRWVYEIEVKLREMRDQQEAADKQEAIAAGQKGDTSEKGNGAKTRQNDNAK